MFEPAPQENPPHLTATITRWVLLTPPGVRISHVGSNAYLEFPTGREKEMLGWLSETAKMYAHQHAMQEKARAEAKMRAAQSEEAAAVTAADMSKHLSASGDVEIKKAQGEI